MLRQVLGSGLLAATVLATLPAHADNRSRVTAYVLSDGTFEVVADFTEDSLYWCGAYLAASRAAAAGTQRIYVLQGVAPSRSVPGKPAVRFGLTPPPQGAASGGFSNSVELIGNSLTLVQAEQTCRERSASG
ncbi:MAG: hypothetical protein WAO69_17550 [Aestuariivita sp.]|uniref:hypothetical protein n=1 Tax=Aestuariivita sp. TaxID=1872407 RepID=UPI003BAF9AE4